VTNLTTADSQREFWVWVDPADWLARHNVTGNWGVRELSVTAGFANLDVLAQSCVPDLHCTIPKQSASKLHR
jgi:hypothetical protein